MKIYQVNHVNGSIKFLDWKNPKSNDTFVIENGEVVGVDEGKLKPMYTSDEDD